MTYAKLCEHQSLARQCEICELRAKLTAAERQIDSLTLYGEDATGRANAAEARCAEWMGRALGQEPVRRLLDRVEAAAAAKEEVKRARKEGEAKAGAAAIPYGLCAEGCGREALCVVQTTTGMMYPPGAERKMTRAAYCPDHVPPWVAAKLNPELRSALAAAPEAVAPPEGQHATELAASKISSKPVAAGSAALTADQERLCRDVAAHPSPTSESIACRWLLAALDAAREDLSDYRHAAESEAAAGDEARAKLKEWEGHTLCPTPEGARALLNSYLEVADMDSAKLAAAEKALASEVITRQGVEADRDAIKDLLWAERRKPMAAASAVLADGQAVAKFRRPEFPGEWYMTDFTMSQVEGRLRDLEVKLAAAEARADARGDYANEVTMELQRANAKLAAARQEIEERKLLCESAAQFLAAASVHAGQGPTSDADAAAPVAAPSGQGSCYAGENPAAAQPAATRPPPPPFDLSDA